MSKLKLNLRSDFQFVLLVDFSFLETMFSEKYTDEKVRILRRTHRCANASATWPTSMATFQHTALKTSAGTGNVATGPVFPAVDHQPPTYCFSTRSFKVATGWRSCCCHTYLLSAASVCVQVHTFFDVRFQAAFCQTNGKQDPRKVRLTISTSIKLFSWQTRWIVRST